VNDSDAEVGLGEGDAAGAGEESDEGVVDGGAAGV
jgi:hypothetical protein